MQLSWLSLYNCFTTRCGLFAPPFGIFTCSCFLIGLYQHACDFMKGLLDVICCFGTRLYILNFFVILNEGLDILYGDCSARLQIAFVTHQKNLSLLGTWTSDLSIPVFRCILERLLVCDIKDYHECMRSSIVWTSYGSETLVTSGIPDL